MEIKKKLCKKEDNGNRKRKIKYHSKKNMWKIVV